MSLWIEHGAIRMVRGDSGRLTVQCTGPDGTARPFTAGESVVFTVKRSHTDLEPLVEKTVTAFTEEGAALVDLLPKDTAGLMCRTYWYDVRLKTGEGEVHTILPRAEFLLMEEIGHV